MLQTGERERLALRLLVVREPFAKGASLFDSRDGHSGTSRFENDNVARLELLLLHLDPLRTVDQISIS